MVNIVRRRALRVACVVVATLSAVLGIAVMAAMSSEPTKQGPVVTEGASSPTASQANVPAVPARAKAPDASRCEPGWSYFDNPVLHYTLCTPPGWGFSDFTSPRPMDAIPSSQLENIHLLSPGAYPWRHGRFPFEAIRTDGVFDVELDLVSADPTSEAECEPSHPVDVSGSTFLTCEQAYGPDGLPADSGDLHALKVLVPLRSNPDDGDARVQNPRLLMILRSRSSASSKEVDTLWQIVRSVRAY